MREQSGSRRLLSGILLMTIVVEWLQPLSKLSNWTDVYTIEPLLITIAGVLAVDVLAIHPFWTWTIKLIIILSSVATMFHGISLLNVGWWMSFTLLIMRDCVHLLTGQWDLISAEGRTLLFIGAWSIAVCWLYMVILYQKIALYVTMVTLIYLLILEMWLDLYVASGVLIVLIMGLSLHGLSVLPTLESKFGLAIKGAGWPVRWIISSILFICLTISCGLLVTLGSGEDRVAFQRPIEGWNWQFIETFTPISLQSLPGYASKQIKQEQKSGYSLNDTELGGAIQSDDSIAFLANTERPDAYWRGESKAVYNGKGWSNLPNDLYHYHVGAELPDVFTDLNNPNSHSYSQDNPTFVQEILPLADYPHTENSTILLSGGAIRYVDQIRNNMDQSDQPELLALDRLEGKYMLQENTSTPVTSYRIRSSEPISSERAKELLDNISQQPPVPDQISTLYEQLPKQLPERISQLAHSITDEYKSAWEKANAIDLYLEDHYRYTLTPKMMAKDSDFVDQFLFEQQEGYCDYFSTAMVIMLRTVGIPARWVKGYAPGEIIDAEENGFLQESSLKLSSSHIETTAVMVRNRDAHSWVEVYMSGVGWTAFDPTPKSVSVLSQSLVQKTHADELPVDQDMPRQLYRYISSKLLAVANRQALFDILWVIGFIMCGQVLRLVYRARSIRSWCAMSYIRLLMIMYAYGVVTDGSDIRLLERLLSHVCSRDGFKIRKDETLRELAARCYSSDERIGAILEFISMYERIRYGPAQRRRIQFSSIKAAWRLLR